MTYLISHFKFLVSASGLQFDNTPYLERSVNDFIAIMKDARKLIRRKVLTESSTTEYKAILEKLGPKLNAFINGTKARPPHPSESDGGQA